MLHCYTIGKSFLLKTTVNFALECELNVCISGLTGKLASTNTEQLSDCRANTVHTNYFIPVGDNQQPNAINWSLADVHVLIVDEVKEPSHVILFFI